MKPGRPKAPEPIARTLSALLDRLDPDRFELFRLTRVWPEAVGDIIARRTEVADLKFHTALVKVSGTMWIQELNLMKPEILSRLREKLGSDTVRELRFVQGRLSRRDGTRLRPVARPPRRAIGLPELKDPELRRAFEALIEAWGRSAR